jgi:group II intron reverse transcriptase/maturase
MLQLFSIFNTIFNDAPENWQYGFQDPATPGFTGIIDLHNTIFFYLIIICVGVFWVLINIIYVFNSSKSSLVHKYLNHGTLIETIWTILPAVVLIAIAFPSFRCAPCETFFKRAKSFRYNWVKNLLEYLPGDNACGIPNKVQQCIAVIKGWMETGLPSSDHPVTGVDMTRLTNSNYSSVGYWGPSVPKQNMSDWIWHIAICNSLSTDSSQEVKSHQKAGNKMSEGLSLQNTEEWSPRDLTAYTSSLMNLSKRRQSLHSSSNTKGDSRNCSGINHLVQLRNASTQANMTKSKKPAVMSVETWLTNELRDRLGKDGKYRNIINLIANVDLLIASYDLIRGKEGNMTPGIDRTETLDKLSKNWFEEIQKKLIMGKYNFKPSKQVNIPKAFKPGTPPSFRTLSINYPRDKIVQKAIQLVLECIWEPKFSDKNNGFRPGISVKSALYQLFLHGDNYSWVIQGDISKCFDRIPHEIIMENLRRHVGCEYTLRLIKKALTCGSMEPDSKKIVRSDMGTPQESVVSPLLANIVLDNLDKKMEEIKADFETGKKRRLTKEYISLKKRKSNTNDPVKRVDNFKKMRMINAVDRSDPNFKRLMYIRYADEFVVLIAGTITDAITIKEKIKIYLQKETGLELNDKKTLITETTKPFKFLGAQCKRTKSLGKLTKQSNGLRRRAVARMRIDIPIQSLIETFKKNKIIKTSSTNEILPTGRKDLVNLCHEDILRFYNSKIHGLLNFYSFARNYSQLHRFVWYLHASCGLTLALKFKLRTLRAAYAKFGKGFKDKDTDIKLYKPENLKAKLSFAIGPKKRG